MGHVFKIKGGFSDSEGQDWRCQSSVESFTPGSGGNWNMVRWYRVCNSCRSINWRTYLCKEINEYKGDGGTTVKLEHPNGKCLSLPKGNGPTNEAPFLPATDRYGVKEALIDAPCSNDDDQKFLLNEDTSGSGTIKLRPIPAIDKNLDVCVASNRMTWDCQKPSDLPGEVVLNLPTKDGTVLGSYLIKMADIPTMPGKCARFHSAIQ